MVGLEGVGPEVGEGGVEIETTVDEKSVGVWVVCCCLMMMLVMTLN